MLTDTCEPEPRSSPTPPDRPDTITARDLHFALRVLVRNERRSLQAAHPAALQRPDLWHPASLDELAGRLNSRTWRPAPASSASRLKAPFATRPLILPGGPEELIVYAHLAARLRDALSDERRAWYGDTLFGNVPTAASETALLEPYLPHMLALNARLERSRAPVMLSLDISGFYEHVQHRVLLDTVRRGGLLGPLDLWLLQQTLDGFAARFHGDAPLPQGLPQAYPTLSAVFAEVHLLPLDTWLRQLGVRYTRYVDDFRIMTTSAARAEVHALRIEAGLRALGLSFSSEKTRLYDRRTDPAGDLPLMGGPAAGRLPETVTAWAGLYSHHGHHEAWQGELRALWEERAAPRDGRPFQRTAARFCLSRLDPDPALIPDVVDVLRRHPQEYESVSWFLRRVPPETLPWAALRAALPEHHHASAAASLLRALAPSRRRWPWPERPAAVDAWLRALRRHPLETVRADAKEAALAWQRPKRRRETAPAPRCSEMDIARALALHLELPFVPEVRVKFPQISPPDRRKEGQPLQVKRLTLPRTLYALNRLVQLAAYQHVSGFFGGLLPLDGQGLHHGHVVNMIGRLDLMREQDRAVYAWALKRAMAWLEPGLSAQSSERIEALLDGLRMRRREQHFATRKEDRAAVVQLNAAVFAEVRAAWSVRPALRDELDWREIEMQRT